MAGLLESLGALVELIAARPDPPQVCRAMLEAVESGSATELPRLLANEILATSALRFAGIVTGAGELAPGARDQLIRAEALVAARESPADRWYPVMTVPDYLRPAIPEGDVHETLPTLRTLIAQAVQRVVLASPFLDAGFEQLIPAIRNLVTRGGTFLLITRELARQDSPNAASVARLRNACGHEERLQVVSWEEEGLGLHLKALVADSRHAYIGSANFTWGGMGQHAELGIHLDGPAVVDIERLLDTLADELRKRRRLQAR